MKQEKLKKDLKQIL